MGDQYLALTQLILNPWNAVLGFCVWAGIQVLKSVSAVFRDGGGLHHTLRLACVAACTACYFIPGPWVDAGLDPGLKVILGLMTGTATTIAHGLVADGRKFSARFLRRAKTAEAAVRDIEAMIAGGKRLAAGAAAAGVAFSGVYGAWFRPESEARAAYEVTGAGIELLSADVDDLDDWLGELTAAHNDLDRNTAIELVLLGKRLEQLEAELRDHHRGYQPSAPVAVADSELSMTAQVAIPDDLDGELVADGGPVIRRAADRLDLPAAKELFR